MLHQDGSSVLYGDKLEDVVIFITSQNPVAASVAHKLWVRKNLHLQSAIYQFNAFSCQ